MNKITLYGELEKAFGKTTYTGAFEKIYQNLEEDLESRKQLNILPFLLKEYKKEAEVKTPNIKTFYTWFMHKRIAKKDIYVFNIFLSVWETFGYSEEFRPRLSSFLDGNGTDLFSSFMKWRGDKKVGGEWVHKREIPIEKILIDYFTSAIPDSHDFSPFVVRKPESILLYKGIQWNKFDEEISAIYRTKENYFKQLTQQPKKVENVKTKKIYVSTFTRFHNSGWSILFPESKVVYANTNRVSSEGAYRAALTYFFDKIAKKGEIYEIFVGDLNFLDIVNKKRKYITKKSWRKFLQHTTNFSVVWKKLDEVSNGAKFQTTLFAKYGSDMDSHIPHCKLLKPAGV